MNKPQACESATIVSERIGERYECWKHPSGLTVLLCPMAGYTGAYALYSTDYGSVDTEFVTSEGERVRIPAGTAHFLEHKMFESESGEDVFLRYAATGASANAYTSFDRTSYLFSCTENFAASLRILLDFVGSPYFTAETVAKEQGIIGQEIRMYDDSPDWRVLFNLLGALYSAHPVHIDIAGTTETIAELTPELLHKVYRAFYRPANMTLCIAGGFDPDEARAVVNELLPSAPSPALASRTRAAAEPREVCKTRVAQTLPVAAPLFELGFKAVPRTLSENALDQVLGELLGDLLFGDCSALFRRLYDGGLLNGDLSCEIMAGDSYLLSMLSGESREPDELRRQVEAELRRVLREGLDDAEFARAKKACYGRMVGSLGSVEGYATQALSCHQCGLTAFAPLEYLSALTKADAEAGVRRLFDPDYSALSVVEPAQEAEE